MTIKLSNTEKPSVVVFACGNLSRGDDAIGPVLLERLEGWLETSGQSGSFELIYDYQLQIEHALDLKDRRLALFIDAGSQTSIPFSFYRATAGATLAHTSHALTPEAVLGVWQQIEQIPPPPAFILCVRGESFELGEAMGTAACQYVDAAFEFLKTLCSNADPAAWQLAQTRHDSSI